MKRTMLAMLLIWGCGGNAKNTPDSQADGTPEPVPAPKAEPAPAPEPAPLGVTPQSLYEECRERIENPQTEGECQTDADCKTAGCGGEVCTTVAEAANVMTTCEDRLCFSVLDACGCHEGQCTWTLKDQVPEGKVLVPAPGGGQPGNALPPSLPPTKGKGPG